MQISRKKINKIIEQEIFHLFYQLIADLKTPQEAQEVLEDLLENSEITAFAKRLAIAHYLNRGRSYQNIKDNLKVSSATIATIDKMRQSDGFQIALRKIESERWASEWSKKIEKLFKR